MIALNPGMPSLIGLTWLNDSLNFGHQTLNMMCIGIQAEDSHA